MCGVATEGISATAHFRNDLNLSVNTLNNVFSIIQKKIGIPLNPVLHEPPVTIAELESYILSSLN